MHMLKTQCKCTLTEEGDDSQFLLSVVLHVLHADFTADLTEMSEINEKAPRYPQMCADLFHSVTWMFRKTLSLELYCGIYAENLQ